MGHKNVQIKQKKYGNKQNTIKKNNIFSYWSYINYYNIINNINIDKSMNKLNNIINKLINHKFVIKDKLTELLEHIKQEIGEVSGRVFVDSAPVMDKVWAKKSGLGWIGKHTNLIHPQNGSFFFIAELIIDLVIEPDGPIQDYCGTCTKCIDACPTEAIVQPYVVDGSKCISYFTIELKDELLPSEFKGKMDNWMFGCDVCQDVCPWNRFSKVTKEDRFKPALSLLDLTNNDWKNLQLETFDLLFQKSAVKRTKFEGLKRNIQFIQKKSN